MTLGASNHTDKEREEFDFYATDEVAIDALIYDGKVEFDKPVWECAAGTGNLVRPLEDYGVDVYASDLIDRGCGYDEIDFLKYEGNWNGDILTNPPYKWALQFIRKSLDIIPEGNRVFMFLKLQFLEGKERGLFFKNYPPKTLYVCRSRILCAKNGNFEEMRKAGGSAVAYMWAEWEKGFTGTPQVKWIY